MQDRYAGDVGDFGKLALLRTLAPGSRLGVCWYRTVGLREANNDGGHLAYLDQPDRFRHLDAELFDALRGYIRAVRAGRDCRAVARLEELELLPPGTLFHGTPCPSEAGARVAWTGEMRRAMEPADLVFLDPDNGLEGARRSPKSVTLEELRSLHRPGRALLLYHHQTRHRGGATAEAESLTGRLFEAGFASVEAIRLRPYSPRFYFLLDGGAVLHARLKSFVDRWGREVETYPRRGAPTPPPRSRTRR